MSISRIKNKILFITGANRGLGLVLVDRFASAGYDVVAVTRISYAEFDDHCRNLEVKFGIKIYNINMDLAEFDSISAGLKEFDRLKIIPTVLVNNASMPYDKITLMCRIQDIIKCFQVNYFSTIQIIQHIAKKMLRTGGCIINISSVSSLTKQAAGVGYSASKSAINTLTMSLAQELAPFKIRVNAIAPGGMKTEMFESTNMSNKNVLVEQTALRRVAEPEEIANVVYFLASDKASYITGQIYRVDGGLKI